MDCKDAIDRLFEARDRADRKSGQVFPALRPKGLANIDSYIQNSVEYVERLVAKFESESDPVETLALSGDLMVEPAPSFAGLQATYAVFSYYLQVLAVYRNQHDPVGWPKSAESSLVKLPGKFLATGKVADSNVGQFVPDIWDGQADAIWNAIAEYNKSDDADADLPWTYEISPQYVRKVWDQLKALVPTTKCIDMANMRKILAKDRADFVGNIVQMHRKLSPDIVKQIGKRQLYQGATGYPGIGSIEAGTEMDKVSIFIDDLHSISGWRPSPLVTSQ
jgi:hypothetical protein